jgi:oligopeptide/dipeptide ABC transporter ATP-binding protein
MSTDVRAEAGKPAQRPDVLLEVKDLQTHFKTRAGLVRAVDGVSFEVPTGASVGIVGESGSGKSVTSLSIMRLIASPGFIAGGQILFQGRDVAGLSEREFRDLRGLALMFQHPMSALNPVYRAQSRVYGRQAGRRGVAGAPEAQSPAAKERAVELFSMVGLPDPERRVHEYPHKLSGGMRQRVTIAMALANEPSLLILDEPTTALDVTIQAQILDLVRDLRKRVNTAVLLITHDIGVVADICEEVVVMYCGRVMERGTVAQVTETPRHPYTVSLLNSIPTPDMKGHKLNTIGGAVPNPLQMPPGCPFQPRCPKAMDICSTKPVLEEAGDGRQIACWLPAIRE